MSARVTDKLELITSSRKLKAKVGERGTEQADKRRKEERFDDKIVTKANTHLKSFYMGRVYGRCHYWPCNSQ